MGNFIYHYNSAYGAIFYRFEVPEDKLDNIRGILPKNETPYKMREPFEDVYHSSEAENGIYVVVTYNHQEHYIEISVEGFDIKNDKEASYKLHKIACDLCGTVDTEISRSRMEELRDWEYEPLALRDLIV